MVNEFLTVNDVRVGDTRTEHQGPGKGTEATGDVNRTGAGEIVDTEFIQPSARVPLPICNAGEDEVSGCESWILAMDLQVVDKSSPAEEEEHTGQQPATFKHGSGQDHGSAGNEGEAKSSIWDKC